MKLSKYLEQDTEPKNTIKGLARKAKITFATIHNLMNGRDVKGSILVKIQRATNGIVTCEEMYSEFVENSKKKKSS